MYHKFVTQHDSRIPVGLFEMFVSSQDNDSTVQHRTISHISRTLNLSRTTEDNDSTVQHRTISHISRTLNLSRTTEVQCITSS
ncbi:hypothetical protein J6590_034190 [Homalodisca vitripennis]|nr:hypothetical protein J6590_034190 [Homalodisca vitripennis]